MAKYTLLEVVNAILNAADENLVNEIDDDEASDSATLVAKEVYFDLIHDNDWPHLNKLSSLTSLSDVTQPTVLGIPDNMTLLDHQEFFQYDVTEAGDNSKYNNVDYEPPGDFMRRVRNRNDSDVAVTKYTGYDSIALLIKTDKMPTYWTSFDDEFIVMDSFHSATESTLQGNKCSIQAKIIPAWVQTNVAVPVLPDNLFPTYIARCKNKYSSYFTQKQNPLDQLEAQSGKARQRKKGHKSAGRNKRRSYGRRS